MRLPRNSPAPSGDVEARAQPAPIDHPLIEKWALAYLGRYASSAENLRQVLRRRVRRRVGREGRAEGETLHAAEGLIDALLDRYRATGLLDDGAYAAGRARGRLARGRPLRRIAAELAAKGVEAAAAEAALAALRDGGGDPDLAAACAFARRRRLGPFRRVAGEGGERRRDLAAFARAGFSRNHAETVLACPDEAAVAALLDRRTA